MKVELKNDSTFYNLSNDHLFKEVFRKKENLKILLQDFFGITVSKIVYKNGETLKKNKKDKKYKKIYEMIEYYNLNEEERCKVNRVAKMLEEEKWDHSCAVEYGRREGESNGIKTGEKRKSLEIAKNMLIENFDIEIVSKITKVSTKKLKKLQKAL